MPFDNQFKVGYLKIMSNFVGWIKNDRKIYDIQKFDLCENLSQWKTVIWSIINKKVYYYIIPTYLFFSIFRLFIYNNFWNATKIAMIYSYIRIYQFVIVSNI